MRNMFSENSDSYASAKQLSIAFVTQPISIVLEGMAHFL